jgi:hypothetical protein
MGNEAEHEAPTAVIFQPTGTVLGLWYPQRAAAAPSASTTGLPVLAGTGEPAVRDAVAVEVAAAWVRVLVAMVVVVERTGVVAVDVAVATTDVPVETRV